MHNAPYLRLHRVDGKVSAQHAERVLGQYARFLHALACILMDAPDVLSLQPGTLQGGGKNEREEYNLKFFDHCTLLPVANLTFAPVTVHASSVSTTAKVTIVSLHFIVILGVCCSHRCVVYARALTDVIARSKRSLTRFASIHRAVNGTYSALLLVGHTPLPRCMHTHMHIHLHSCPPSVRGPLGREGPSALNVNNSIFMLIH